MIPKTALYAAGGLGIGSATFITWRVYERNQLKVMLAGDPLFEGLPIGLVIQNQLPMASVKTADHVYEAAVAELLAMKEAVVIGATEPTTFETGIPAVDTALAVAQSVGIDTSPVMTAVLGRKNPTEAMLEGSSTALTPAASPASGLASSVFMLSRLLVVPAAIGLSYTRNNSVGWAALHGLLIPTWYLGYRGVQFAQDKYGNKTRRNWDWGY